MAPRLRSDLQGCVCLHLHFYDVLDLHDCGRPGCHSVGDRASALSLLTSELVLRIESPLNVWGSICYS